MPYLRKMNFLAHAYLSFGHPDLLTGNMMADSIQGLQKTAFPEALQKGIALHHAIDTFTDNHPVTQEAKLHFRPDTGKYAGVFMDVVYDHFLANDPDRFPPQQLKAFTQHTYAVLQQHDSDLPERFKKVLYHMKKEDWLWSYRQRSGIQKAFAGIYHRATFLPSSDAAFGVFNLQYASFQRAYTLFMPALEEHAKRIYLRMLHQPLQS